ncbi:MAG TPA: ABC transporter ATP-binding protein [Usitatibacter sp.]|jgi:ABC-2 type transport system ATP-binding protein|nr:ABC transporter ATP-binding protein [Usitatibacter sp.]
MVPALEIRGLLKQFGGKPAVDGLDLTVPQGEFHALLGPNGAGKTTTLRIVAGLTTADQGSVSVLGRDLATDPMGARRVLAFLSDDPMLYGKLDALEYLEFVAGLWSLEPRGARARAVELLELLGLAEQARQRVERYSRGMRQKLALAGALIHDPALMILDEPLTGLDAAAARLVKDLLVARVRAGGTVILTTHILEIAERLAERISIIARGRILAQGTLGELRGRAGRGDTLEDVFLQLTAPDAHP